MWLEVKSCEVSDFLSLNSVSKNFTEVLTSSLESKWRIWSDSLSEIADASLIEFSIRRKDENSENEVVDVLEYQDEWLK